ncbi:MAG TPA: DUF1800 domain-containing protein [Capillimicrobium sp.]
MPSQGTHAPIPLPDAPVTNPVVAVPDAGAPPQHSEPSRQPATGGGGGGGSTGEGPPPPRGKIDSPIATYTGTFGRRQAERLLWRAGFGPWPGQAEELAAMGLEDAVLSLTRVSGEAPLRGPEPTDYEGNPLRPTIQFNHDLLFWLDRMARSEHSLVERMALIWHDWFPCQKEIVQGANHMLAQTAMFRTHGLGSFADLLAEVTASGAMLLFLNGVENHAPNRVNENYGRELMELFTLGADRGAYTERDVKEIARALSGYTASYSGGDGGTGWHSFRFDPSLHDGGAKSVLGKTGNFGPQDVHRLVLEHPLHPSFFVGKLWSYFLPTEPPAGVQAALEQAYVASGHQIRPIVEAILCSPQLYDGPPMIKPPVVHLAGMFRALEKPMRSEQWDTICAAMGQRVYEPPDVSGWNDAYWLDTSTMRARVDAVADVLQLGWTISQPEWATYPRQTAEQAVAEAIALWGDPPLSDATRAVLADFARSVPADAAPALHAQRQNALRHLVMASPDAQVC